MAFGYAFLLTIFLLSPYSFHFLFICFIDSFFTGLGNAT